MVIDRTEFSEIKRNLWTEVTASAGCSYSGCTNEWNASDLSDAEASVISEVNSKASKSWDLLTEVAEAREIPGLVHDIASDLGSILKLLRGRFSVRDLKAASRIAPINLLKHPKDVFKKIGDWWMRYRYGIMPLVYSTHDVIKTITRGQNVTSRAMRVVKPRATSWSRPASTQKYSWAEYDGEIVVRACAFQHFDSVTVSQVSGIGFNPLVTAWELIPYSFVLDWFINAGDYIAANTSSVNETGWNACISHRAKHTKKTWVHYPNQNLTISTGLNLCTNWQGSYPPTPESQIIQRPEENQLLREEMVDEYSRVLFPLHDVHLTLNPSLNWRRYADSCAMAANLLRNLIKSFRR